jgi:hypothetical protein
MVNRNQKNQNALNLFLNDYFGAFLAVFLILFLVGAYFFVIRPKYQETLSLVQANIEQQQLIYQNSAKKLANLKALAEIYKKISPADLQKFNSVLPDAYVRERLFGELEELAGQGGWLVTQISISPAEDPSKALAPTESTENIPGAGISDKKLGRVSLEITLSAIDYAGLKNFLKILETNLRLFDVTDVSFSPAESSATLVLTTYYYQTTP